METRINKFLSEVGYCSRRAADKLLEQGRITLNGNVPELGTKVKPDDEVRVDGKLVGEGRRDMDLTSAKRMSVDTVRSWASSSTTTE